MSCDMFEFCYVVDKFGTTLNVDYRNIIVFYIFKCDFSFFSKRKVGQESLPR